MEKEVKPLKKVGGKISSPSYNPKILSAKTEGRKDNIPQPLKEVAPPTSFSKKEVKAEGIDKKRVVEQYNFISNKIPISITIYRDSTEFVPIYDVSIETISKTVKIILDKIRQELIREVSLKVGDITDAKKTTIVEDKFKETIGVLIDKYFPDVEDKTKEFLTSYLIENSLGLGQLEILMNDDFLEEIAVNSANESVWVYHKKHGWLKTNIFLSSEEKTRHYATMIGRKVGRQITSLNPLLDAYLNEGDRVNATLMPISSRGNTITLRKVSRDPWTITKFMKFKTISPQAAALIWLGMQYELSAIIAGGTASGKTAMLNVLANFLPPNQRIISIEDTREIQLPRFLHWVPMSTRESNTEGRGEISMEDLLVNSLRQRPDRILVGEVRRRREAETLFEAIHTGHSVYATFHANDTKEAITRLINPPIDIPKTMLPAISMLIIQYRNRRTGLRRTFQLSEIQADATGNILMQYDTKKDVLNKVNKSTALMSTLELFTGFTPKELNNLLKEKEQVLHYLIDNNIDTINGVGRVMAEYYTDKDNLMKFVDKKQLLTGVKEELKLDSGNS